MNTIVEYKNKKIDLAPYFKGFPYFNFDVNEKTNKVYYLRRGEETLLFSHSLTDKIRPSEGTQTSELNFSKFNKFSRFRYNTSIEKLLYTGDKENKEQLNIWALDPETGERERLTNEEYIYGKGYNPKETKIAFIARKDIENGYRSKLKILDLSSGEIKEVISDDDEWTFTWGKVLWNHGDTLIWSCNHKADRNKSNLILYNKKKETKKILLDQDQKRSMLYTVKNWLNPTTFLFISNEGGYKNLYQYNLEEEKAEKLTSYKHDLKTAQLKELDDRKYLITILDHPISDKIKLVHPSTGEEILSKSLKGSCRLLHTDNSRVFIIRNSLDIPLELKEITFNPETEDVSTQDIITYSEELLDEIIHGCYEAIKYKTFDKNPETGKKRKIHAFVLIPDDLPEDPSERRAIITAFYGGRNRFSKRYQILLEAGFILLSPAIRGSFGFGKEFYSLIDGDLGGDEVIDLIHGARYLMERFDLESEEQIGLQGGSHGGYEAMRALTFPPEVNGRREHFDWGFAISDYGISDLISYYETCNIPDWVTQKAGDPEEDREQLIDRSPVTHAELATGPLFLAHGENDSRVPVEQSRKMANAMEKVNKPYQFEEFSDQGHGWEGLKENLQYFSKLFEFLSNET